MEKEYNVRLAGDKSVIVHKTFLSTPQAYLISARDLFAALQALEIMGVFDKQQMPGYTTRLFFSGEDIATLGEYAKTNRGQEDVTD